MSEVSSEYSGRGGMVAGKGGAGAMKLRNEQPPEFIHTWPLSLDDHLLAVAIPNGKAFTGEDLERFYLLVNNFSIRVW